MSFASEAAEVASLTQQFRTRHLYDMLAELYNAEIARSAIMQERIDELLMERDQLRDENVRMRRRLVRMSKRAPLYTSHVQLQPQRLHRPPRARGDHLPRAHPPRHLAVHKVR